MLPGVCHEPIQAFADKGRIAGGQPMDFIIKPGSFGKKNSGSSDADGALFALAVGSHLIAHLSSHGLSTATPVGMKSLAFRVTTVMP